MRRYSEAVKADVRRRMSPPMRQSVAQISAELGIHVVTLYSWRKAWRLAGQVVPASQKDPEGWGPADKFTVVLETAGLNTTELSAYCRERGLYPEQVDRWRQAAQDANAQPLLTMAEQTVKWKNENISITPLLQYCFRHTFFGSSFCNSDYFLFDLKGNALGRRMVHASIKFN